MVLQPANVKNLTETLAAAHTRRESVTAFDLRAFQRVLEHRPEDMTATVECGLTLGALQAQLATRGQWLPIDPPNPAALTLGALLATNASGPRRFGYGTIRDHLIGLTVALADGRIVKSGGKVVKNVAGYDLQKVFIGSRGSLGVMIEAVFKLRPLPAAEQFVEARFATIAPAVQLIEAVLESPLTPAALDLHRPNAEAPFTVVLGFAGTTEEVQWQLNQAAALGVKEPSSLAYHESFWNNSIKPQRDSVLPSNLAKGIDRIGNAPFVAHAGNGVIYYRGGPAPAKAPVPAKLSRRLKDEFDPRHIFPELPA